MNEDHIAKDIVDACYHVHVALGPGLLESVYEEVLAHELRLRGYSVERQKPISIIYKGTQMDMAFRVDLIVENKVIIELKSVEELAPVHYKQVLTYLRLADVKLGILVNFNEALIKSGLKRVVNNL